MRELTIEEARDIIDRYLDACREGNRMKATLIAEENVPLDPSLAMSAKKSFGKEFLLNTKWDLSNAEEVYGKDWLDR